MWAACQSPEGRRSRPSSNEAGEHPCAGSGSSQLGPGAGSGPARWGSEVGSVALEGSTSLTLEGRSQVKLAGAQVKLAADAQLTLESTGIAKLQGGTTTIGGSLIKAG